ncbi:flagellar hook-basal body complex protein FliE [Nitratireductor sp. XY-223]|uniref:flagellar hook-basal body complex protein FliE n=1 Tax=Nitratireductor sp. XY-223 TaxID=2561926 RepID=UPI0010A9FAFC|nr:flagellar hook-basal body complex protein FliE [Nitratireductor sp. XY-223]
MIDAVGAAAITSLTRPVEQTAEAGATGPASGSGGSEFSAMLSDMVSDMTATMHRGEEMSIKGINGQAGTQEVVEAVMSAERTLQTAIAVRDKIVTAYLEISRMAI